MVWTRKETTLRRVITSTRCYDYQNWGSRRSKNEVLSRNEWRSQHFPLDIRLRFGLLLHWNGQSVHFQRLPAIGFRSRARPSVQLILLPFGKSRLWSIYASFRWRIIANTHIYNKLEFDYFRSWYRELCLCVALVWLFPGFAPPIDRLFSRIYYCSIQGWVVWECRGILIKCLFLCLQSTSNKTQQSWLSWESYRVSVRAKKQGTITLNTQNGRRWV